MEQITFTLGDEFIPLISLIKLLRISESGGQAKMMVDDGIVTLNGEVESRYRAKLRGGDIVEIAELGYVIEILAPKEAKESGETKEIE